MTDQLPAGLEYVRTTEVFDQDHHPAGLRRSHRVAGGVWARLLVHSGELAFVFDDEGDRPAHLTAGGAVVIPPGRQHHIEITGTVAFVLEFHREPEGGPPATGTESTGLTPS